MTKTLLMLVLLAVSLSASSSLADEGNSYGQNQVHGTAADIWSMQTGVTLVSMLVAIAALVFARRDRSEDLRRSMLDEYLLRGLLSPVCVEPFIEFVFRNAKDLDHLDKGWPLGESRAEDYSRFLRRLKAEKEELVLRFRLLSVYDAQFYETAVEALDSLDDSVTKHCASRITHGSSRRRRGPRGSEAMLDSYVVVVGRLTRQSRATNRLQRLLMGWSQRSID